MARADAASFTRVQIVAPRTRVDVALPAEIPVVELLPLLLDMVGERSDDGGAAHDGWVLSAVGGAEFDPARSLRALDVLDGSALELRTRRSAVAEPIFDDVVDAIASSVREHTDTRPLREVTGSVAAGAGLLVAAFVLVRGEHSLGAAALAAAAAVLALAGATGIARTGTMRGLAVTVGGSGAALALVAGILAIPGPFGYPAALLGAAAALTYAVLAGMLLRTGAVVFSALATVSGLGLLGALAGLPLSARPAHVAILLAAGALGAMTVLPWIATRMARLPMPVIPTTPDHLRDLELGVDFAAVSGRAAVAAEYLDGTILGCGLVAGVGATVALAQGTAFAALFGVAVAAALMLRVRSVPGRLPRLGLFSTGTAALGLGLSGATLAFPEQSMMTAALTLAAAGVAVLLSVLVPRRRLSPMTGRSIDIAENLVLVAVLPLALGAVDLYTTVRHW